MRLQQHVLALVEIFRIVVEIALKVVMHPTALVRLIEHERVVSRLVRLHLLVIFVVKVVVVVVDGRGVRVRAHTHTRAVVVPVVQVGLREVVEQLQDFEACAQCPCGRNNILVVHASRLPRFVLCITCKVPLYLVFGLRAAVNAKATNGSGVKSTYIQGFERVGR